MKAASLLRNRARFVRPRCRLEEPEHRFLACKWWLAVVAVAVAVVAVEAVVAVVAVEAVVAVVAVVQTRCF